MAFVKPSTITNDTGAYEYKQGVSSNSFNYIDNSFPNMLDKTGDFITGAIVVNSGGTYEFQSGSSLTIDSGATVTISSGAIENVSGQLNLLTGSLLDIKSGSTFTIESGSTTTFHGTATVVSGGVLDTAAGGNLTVHGTETFYSGSNLTTNTGSTATFNGTVNLAATSVVAIHGTTALDATLTVNSTGTISVASSGTVSFASGGILTIPSGTVYTTQVWPSWITPVTRNIILNTSLGQAGSGSTWNYQSTGGVLSGAVGSVLVVPLVLAHNGATLSSVTVNMIVGNSHAGGVPAVFPQVAVYRTDTAGNVVSLSTQTIQTFGTTPGFGTAPATGADWYNSGLFWNLVYTCNQNNVIDNGNYTYTLKIQDELGTNSETTNVYYNNNLNSRLN